MGIAFGRGLRALVALGAVAAATASSAGGGWDHSSKKFSLAFSPASVTTGSNPAFVVRIKNETPDGSAEIKSVEIDLPHGFAVGGTVAFDPPRQGTIYASSGATKVYVKSMAPLKKGQSAVLKLPLTVSSSSGCSAKDWSGSEAFTGSHLNGDDFKRVSPTGLPSGYAATTTVQAGLALAFVAPLPTSAVQNQPFSITVKQTSACAGTLPPVTVTLTGSPSGPFTGSSGTTGANGQVTLTGKFSELVGGATVTASAPGYTPVTSAPFSVFANEGLECAASTTPDPVTAPPSTRFSGSPPGVTQPSQTAYAEGVRGPNKNGASCVPVNYTFTNNVLGSGAVVDAAGNTVPPNGTSFLWDRVLQPDLTATYSVTFRSEWVDATGVPTLRTRVCTTADCNPTTGQALAKACLGTALVAASLPPGEKICVASESWATVPPTDPYYCALPAPATPAPACVQVTSTFVDIFDPVIIRN